MQRKGLNPCDVVGPWLRWSEYELLDGVVLPSSEASRELYDPWKKFSNNEGTYRTVEQPYSGLLELGRAIKAIGERELWRTIERGTYQSSGTSQKRLHPDADALVLQWCRENGLLGLLPSMCTYMEEGRFIPPGSDSSSVVARYRLGSKWVEGGYSDREIDFSELLKADPHTLVTLWDSPGQGRLLMPSTEWLRFFPRLKVDHPAYLPYPGSDQFWREYGEPTYDIATWAVYFAANAEQCCSERCISSLRYPVEFFTCLAQHVPITFLPIRRELEIQEVRESTGLLASYGLMFLWDLKAGRRTLKCENEDCGHYFVSDVKRARYCSRSCRYTESSRRYRSRNTGKK
jgi:hypothetical protein